MVLKSGTLYSEVSPPHYDRPNWKTTLCYIQNTGIRIQIPRAMPDFSDTRYHKMKVVSKLNVAPLQFIIERNRQINNIDI